MSPPIAVVEVGPRDGLQSLDAGIDTERKLAMIERLLDAGVVQIEVTSFAHARMVPRLADTIGRAQPRPVAALCHSIVERWPDLRLGVHLHGADARGVACAASAVYAGAVHVETAILGLGGPIVRSPGTEVVGNLSTEGLLPTFAGLGIEMGLDPDRVQAAACDVAAILGLPRPAARPDLGDVEPLIVKRSPAL